MNLSVCLLEKSDDTQLILFLNKLGNTSEQVLGYHYPFYREMLGKTGVGSPLYVGIKDTTGNILALLPGFIKTQPEGTVYSSLPFFGPNGGLLLDSSLPDQPHWYQIVFDFLFKTLTAFDIVTASFYSPFNGTVEVDHIKKSVPEAFEIKKFTSYIPLTGFALSNAFVDDSALRNVRKAQKSGVTVRTHVNAGDVDAIYSIYLQNCRDYSIPIKPRETVEFLLSDPSAKENVNCYIAEHEGKIIGALIMISSPLTASYYIPCNVHEYRNFQPNALLIATALEDAMKNSKKFWNWESSPSKESGVYQFKKKWGSVDSDYVIFIKAFKEKTYFESLGQAKISQLYPYFFVYPFNLL